MLLKYEGGNYMAQIAEVIKYEGDNSAFIWKHPSVDFNSLTQLIVHESQEALKDQVEPFDHNNNYQKTVRFAEEEVMRAKGNTKKGVI